MTDMWTGGCQCGQVRYEVEADRVLTLYCCHCRECQRQSASAFGMSLIVPRPAFAVLGGSMRTWVWRTASGSFNRGHFCPTCGVRLYHDGGSSSPEISVKAGTLDDTTVLHPVGHLWSRRAQPWVRFPNDVLLHEEEPESEDEAYALYRERLRG